MGNHTYKLFNVKCVDIPCPTTRGWSGHILPNCTFKPFCPDSYPGNFPFCNKYAKTTKLPTAGPIKTAKPSHYGHNELFNSIGGRESTYEGSSAAQYKQPKNSELSIDADLPPYDIYNKNIKSKSN